MFATFCPDTFHVSIIYSEVEMYTIRLICWDKGSVILSRHHNVSMTTFYFNLNGRHQKCFRVQQQFSANDHGNPAFNTISNLAYGVHHFQILG